MRSLVGRTAAVPQTTTGTEEAAGQQDRVEEKARDFLKSVEQEMGYDNCGEVSASMFFCIHPMPASHQLPPAPPPPKLPPPKPPKPPPLLPELLPKLLGGKNVEGPFQLR